MLTRADTQVLSALSDSQTPPNIQKCFDSQKFSRFLNFFVLTFDTFHMSLSDIGSTKENGSVKDRELEDMTIKTPDYSDPKAKKKLMLVIAA